MMFCSVVPLLYMLAINSFIMYKFLPLLHLSLDRISLKLNADEKSWSDISAIGQNSAAVLYHVATYYHTQELPLSFI